MEKKICSKCQVEKAVESFSFRNKSKGLRHSICVECNKVHKKKHYQNNKDYYKQKAAKRNMVIIAENKRRVYEFLSENPCIDCGEKDPIVLEFDHVRGTKRTEVSVLANGGFSWETVKKEMDKCDIRCANCHKRKTVKQFGWYRGKAEKLL